MLVVRGRKVGEGREEGVDEGRWGQIASDFVEGANRFLPLSRCPFVTGDRSTR